MPIGPVAFENTPSDTLVPAYMVEFNAGPPNYAGTSRQIVLGRALAGSPAALAGVPVNVGGQNPNAVCGYGSMGAEQLLYARRRNPIGEIYFLDVGAPSGGPAASVGALTFAGTATTSGTITRYVGGERYDVNVGANDTGAMIATAFAAAFARGYTKFNTRMLAAVTAAVDGTTANKVNLTARHAGTETNALRIEAGLNGDEDEVPGITVTITAMTGGTGDVDMATVLAKLGAQPYDWICGPYNTTAQLDAVRDFLADSGNGRSAPLVGLLGHYTTHKEGNLSGLTAFGQNCEGQEARGSGWVIKTGYGIFRACRTQDAGQANGLDAGTLPDIRAGVHLYGSGCIENDIDMAVQAGVRIFSSIPFLGSHALYVGPGAADNRGRIEAMKLLAYAGRTGTGTTRDDGAKIGGVGVSNGTNTRLLVDGVALT